jgi:hypothetical protein
MEDIKSITSKAKSVLEIKKYAEDLFNKLSSALLKIQDQEKEIEHLKTLIGGAVPIIAPNDIGHNQLLCEMEIARLQKTAEMRPLSIEEAKKFDIFNKNLLAIKKPKKEEDDHYVDYDDAGLIDLIGKKD